MEEELADHNFHFNEDDVVWYGCAVAQQLYIDRSIYKLLTKWATLTVGDDNMHCGFRQIRSVLSLLCVYCLSQIATVCLLLCKLYY